MIYNIIALINLKQYWKYYFILENYVEIDFSIVKLIRDITFVANFLIFYIKSRWLIFSIILPNQKKWRFDTSFLIN